jgi:hypothetical protein
VLDLEIKLTERMTLKLDPPFEKTTDLNQDSHSSNRLSSDVNILLTVQRVIVIIYALFYKLEFHGL